MLLCGSIVGDKTQRLVESYTKLLNSGVDASKILVIVQNSNRKNDFIGKTLERLTVDVIEKMQVYSFYGLVYNTVSDNWAIIENKTPDELNTKIIPNLCGLEVSQFIMKQIISEIKFEGYNSKKSLLHQLFRRYSLIVQNNLSDAEVMWRSEQVLKESFAPDAKKALDEFKKKTLEARALDYLRQSLIFNYLYKNTKYFSNIEYLIVDDGDEITPICFDFINHLKPQLKDFFVAYDELGSSRSGYLSADKKAVFKFEELFNQKAEQLFSKSDLEQDAKIVFENVIEQKNTKLKHFSLSSLSKRAQMLDVGIEEIKRLINNGVKASDISIITPIIDDMLKFCIKDVGANPVFLSGSEKIIQNPIVLASLNILKFCNSELKQDLSEFDARAILNFLNIPLKHCKDVLENFEKTKTFVDFKFKLDEYSEKYKKFLEVLKILPGISKLSEQVYEIYENLVQIKNFTADEITKFNFFIKQLEDFENVFADVKNADIINQIENSIISENPYSVLEIKDNDLIIATPQKIIDNQIQTKFQFWFDVSSDEWIKNDTGPLYNAWVFQAGWEKSEFTLQDNIELSRQKTARILRKLTLCSKEKIYAYASLFDASGIENYGGIEKYLSIQGNIQQSIKSGIFTPRDDQKAVLEYKKGKMAISAVPGAGKTTILLALIIKLLNDGVNPENIFVLTYMESAARNFRERIQNANQELSQLPNISTIHGLALKILKENANYERLGLNADFEICDDTQRSRILRELCTKLDIKKTESEDFDRAVSILKIGGGLNTNNTLTLPLPLSKHSLDVSFGRVLKGEGFKEFNITSCHYSQTTLNQAKALRKTTTEPEQIIWYLLRDKNFCDLKFRRQAPIGKYIVDFVCLEKKLVIELDGSGHLQQEQTQHDEERRKYIEGEGYKILRFFNIDIFNNLEGVLEKIYQMVFDKDCPNSPSPLRGEGRVRVQKVPTADKKLSKFLEFFNEYKRVLQENNLIDYDDMLLFSVKLLEENPDILKYYQEICHYVIEDEAQDSSAIQQKLIELLSGKHKNLIRCGDVNQAITTTFSNADFEGFRRFIETSEAKVSMDRSQRCTEDVWRFANSLIIYSQSKPETKNTFYPIFMRPVEGKNPKGDGKCIYSLVLENEFAEKNYILKQIKDLFAKNPKATVGILLRSNFQVASWTKFINNAGLRTITRSECLEQKGIFRTIFAIMKIILNPFDNQNIADSYDVLAELGHCKSNLYQTIKECPKSFVQMNVDEMNNVGLESFYWDLIYWLSFSSLAPEELAIKIGLHYYSSDIEKSNVYLISTLIKRLSNTYNKYSILIERLGELAKKPNLSGFKFFSEEEKSDREILEGKVQVMTLHKSKGDEFDYVFLPEMLEKNLPLAFENVTLKKNARFMEEVREFNPNYKNKSDDELKEFLLAENLRLIYVAITRAKRKLYITANKSSRTSIVPEPSVIFKNLKEVNIEKS